MRHTRILLTVPVVLTTLCAPIVLLAQDKLSPSDIRSAVLKDPRINRTMGVVYIGDSLFAMMPSSKKGSPGKRAATVATRVKQLAGKKIARTDITVGQVHGLWVVKVPTRMVKEGFVVTADPDFAHLRNRAPQDLAKQLAEQLYISMTSPRVKTLGDPETDQEFFDAGLKAYSAGNMEEAVKDFSTAIEKSPGFAEAYLSLIGVYVKQGNTQMARETLSTFNKKVGGGKLDADQKTILTSLEKQIK